MSWYVNTIRRVKAQRQDLIPTDDALALFGSETVHGVTIVRAPDRDQLRGQITGKKSIRTVGYPSKKMRRARYGEAGTECNRIPEEEVVVDFVDAIAQQVRVEAYIGDKIYTHILDFTNLLADGRRVLADAKRTWADFRKPDGVKQTFLGMLAAEAMGYEYERIVFANGGDDVRRSNIDEIQASRFVPVPDHLVARAARALGQGPISLGNLGALLHPVNSRSMAYALMIRRVVEIDLDSRLTDKSECRAVPPLPLSMPSIRR
ncbi:hypothetical protein [Sphingomonas sp. UYEF23]|uniref:hypothetical protein n=1 Tax=Sphingomonas sp. UYEF23 TaxID=1756408 RepID=UPI00339279BD